MKGSFGTLFGMVGALLATQASAQGPDLSIGTPVSPWTLEAQPTSCSLSRTFQFDDGGGEVELQLLAYQPGKRFFLRLTGEAARVRSDRLGIDIVMAEVENYSLPYVELEIGGLPALDVAAAIAIGPLTEDLAQRMASGEPIATYSDPDWEERVTWMGFGRAVERNILLHTAAMRAPIDTLNECTVEMLEDWDIDHASHAAGLSRMPMPEAPPYPWLRKADFPERLRHDGLVHYQLVVNPLGRVAACRIAHAEDSDFERIACERLTAIARFNPALDGRGDPVQSYFVQWQVLRD